MTSASRGLFESDEQWRCWWCEGDSLYQLYHDREWGRPVTDDRQLFEKVCLEAFQAGLSWLTILRKRENFRRAFAAFDFERLAEYGTKDVERLLSDAGIVRHRGKIEAVLGNARRAIALREECGSLAAFFWRYEPPPEERPARLDFESVSRLQHTPASRALSRDLKKRGWAFVGPTTCYAFMQAMGLVNDHLEGCASRGQVERERAALRRPTHST